MDLLIKIVMIFCLSSCAKFNYLLNQGAGQLKLQMDAEDNEKVLNDPKVPQEHKQKIAQIIEYKKFFYNYFKENSTEIYDQTTILKTKAVTHLVIASAYDEIKPVQTCFWPIGCFPYLGFFDEEDAKDYMSTLERENYVTYKRPVYAYSTLGHFDDSILSSFFYYQEDQLAELIFHELFHTILFVKDEVDLNENLASFFSEQLVITYFSNNKNQLKKVSKDKKTRDILNRKVVSLVDILKKKYLEAKKQGEISKKQARIVLNTFLTSVFMPSIEKQCDELKIPINNCHYLHRDWNNASFTAFLTYNNKEEKLLNLYQKKGANLFNFYSMLKKKYQDYEDFDKSDEMNFETFLFQ